MSTASPPRPCRSTRGGTTLIRMNRKVELPAVIRTREVGTDRVKAARKSGEWERVRTGVSRPSSASSELPWERDREAALATMAAVASTLRTEFAFCQTDAARVHELELPPWDGRAHVMQRHRQGIWRVEGLHHHWVPVWGDDDVVEVDGMLVTSLPRTIIDCAMTLRPDFGLGVADSGLRKLARVSRFDREESLVRQDHERALLLDQLSERARAKGVVQARAIIPRADGFAESMPESRHRWVALAFGAPEPVLQLPVMTRDGVRYTDLAWPLADLTGEANDPRIIAEEYDGVDKYDPQELARPAAVINAQARRDESLRLAGVEIRHRGARDLDRPEALFAAIVSRFPPGVLPPRQPVPALAIRPVRARSRRPR